MKHTIKRLQKELEELIKDPIENCTACPINDNLHHWTAQIYGPKDTPYEGGIFNLTIRIPENYPFSPPKINFKTKVYHPNINSTGIICLDILKDKWVPSLGISSVLILSYS